MVAVWISEELRFALTEDAGAGAGLGVEGYRIAGRTAELLGVGSYVRDSPLAVGLLLRLLPTLEDVVAGKAQRDLVAPGKTLVLEATKDLTREELYSILKAFGWEDERVVGEPKFSGLAKVMRRTIAESLAGRLNEMCIRWRAGGILDATVQRKRSVDPQARRDRAMTKQYLPPGRT